jgi:hypothetical protein
MIYAVHCFYHPERVAVGTCRACGRGLCTDSLADLNSGLACRGRCEGNVEAMASNLRYSTHIAGLGSAVWVWYAVLLLLYGVGAFSYGLETGQGIVNAWSGTGVLSLLGAIACFRLGRKVHLKKGAA